MLLGVVVWVAGIVVKVGACLEGTHGCLLEGGTGEAGEAGEARRAVLCVSKTGGGFVLEQLPLRDGRQLLHCLFDFTHIQPLHFPPALQQQHRDMSHTARWLLIQISSRCTTRWARSRSPN